MVHMKEKMLIIDGEQIKFSKPIKNVLEIEDIVIVLLQSVGTLDDFNNIYAIKSKRFFWQIQDFQQYLPSIREYPGMNIGSYVAIQIDNTNNTKFLATTFSGHVYSIEVQSGLICEKITCVK